jgi:hypothetical protein
VANLAEVAIGFAQEEAGRRVSVADRFDEHGYIWK